MSGVGHEKAVVMKYIFDIKRDYSGIKHQPDYLKRAHVIPTFTPLHLSDTSSRTMGLYQSLGNSLTVPYKPIEVSSESYQPTARNGSGYKGNNSASFMYQS
ncbi:MAG: hypothetical protein WCV90_01905 [Candidatus Woesearchaeota archaeon]|jgi:hypothetical protein